MQTMQNEDLRIKGTRHKVRGWVFYCFLQTIKELINTIKSEKNTGREVFG